MTPSDFRNVTFRELETRMTGDRMRAYEIWLHHPDCTTREAAQRGGMDLLTLRPRTTELVQMGFVVLSDTQDAAGQGRYRARTWAEAARFHAERGLPVSSQLALC